MNEKRIPLPDGYEPTAFTPEGSRARLFFGVEDPMALLRGEDTPLGDVLQYDHSDSSGNLPHMGLRNVDEEWHEVADEDGER